MNSDDTKKKNKINKFKKTTKSGFIAEEYILVSISYNLQNKMPLDSGKQIGRFL